MAHPDYDELMNVMLPFAQRMLSKEGSFFPFGASKDVQGKIGFCAPHPDRAKSETQEILDALINGLFQRVQNNEIIAGGFCFDTRAIPPGKKDKTDAICLHIERSGEKPIEAYVPYSKSLFKKITYGNIFASGTEAWLFK